MVLADNELLSPILGSLVVALKHVLLTAPMGKMVGDTSKGRLDVDRNAKVKQEIPDQQS